MQLNQVQSETPRKYSKRVGRGSKRGKTSGRGTKGQNARAGHRVRPEIRDMLKKLPKRRGYGKNRARTVDSSTVKPRAVNLKAIEGPYGAGEKVTPQTLFEKGLVSRSAGRLPHIKILGDGEFSKRVTISGCTVSGTARAAIEKVGGTIE